MGTGRLALKMGKRGWEGGHAISYTGKYGVESDKKVKTMPLIGDVLEYRGYYGKAKE